MIKSAGVLAVFLIAAVFAAHFTIPLSGIFGSPAIHRVSHDGFTTERGELVRLDSTPRGALIVLGYTRCADECPIVVSKVAAAARLSRRNARPRLFFLTVDPAYDRPVVLHRYLALWGGEVIGLRGDPVALKRVSASLGAGDPARARDHDTRLFVVDRSGVLVREASPDISVDDLSHLLQSVAWRPE